MRILENTHLGLVSGGLAAIPGGGDGYIDSFEGGGGGGSTSEMIITAERPNNLADAVISAGLGAATRGAVVALAEGVAAGAGLAAGSTLLVAAPVIGAALGAYVAYKAFTR